MKTFLGIIIVTHNSTHVLEQCLESLQIQEQSGEWQLFVVDNASKDESLDKVEKYFPQATIVKNAKNVGFGKAANQGATKAIAQGCTHLFFLNPDTFLNKNCVQKIFECFQKYNISCVQPSVLLTDRERVNTVGNELSYIGVSYCPDFLEKFQPRDHEVLIGSGVAFMITSVLWKKAGGFVENYFMYVEDTEFFWRLALMGEKVLVSGDAVVYHEYMVRLAPWKFFYLERNRIWMLFTNYGVSGFLLLVPILLFFESVILFHSILRGYFFHKCAALFCGWGGLIFQLPHLFRIKKLKSISNRTLLDFMAPSIRRVPLEESRGLVGSVINDILELYFRLFSLLLPK